jgi:hypothetical protein
VRHQPHAQALGAASFADGAHFGADFFRHRRDVGQALRQRQKVKPGAPDKHGALVLPLQFLDHAARRFQPVAGRISLARIDMAEQVMRHAGHLLVRRH